MTESDARRRATKRRSWPVRKFRLGEEPEDSLLESATAEERLEMMWPLALEAWELSGRPLPDYSRAETPVRIVRRQSAG